MRRLFVSYARENKRDVDQLVEHLGLMGYETWVDTRLRGGQDWWDEILRRIASSDVFLAVISEASLDSTACRRELDWAEALGKPVLPVAIEPPPAALPRRLARRQIIDYSLPEQRDRAAVILQGGLGTVPAAPPIPEPLPESPAPPLSYLTDLVDLVTQSEVIDHDHQVAVLGQLEAALRSVDPEERRGGRDILERFYSRHDLSTGVAGKIERLRTLSDDLARFGAEAADPLPVTKELRPRRGPLLLFVPALTAILVLGVGLIWILTSESSPMRSNRSATATFPGTTNPETPGAPLTETMTITGADGRPTVVTPQSPSPGPTLIPVFIGADCAPLGAAGITPDGAPAYCSILSSTGDSVWSLFSDKVPIPTATPDATDEVYPPGIEEQVRVCVDQTGQTRQKCREDIARGNISGPG